MQIRWHFVMLAVCFSSCATSGSTQDNDSAKAVVDVGETEATADVKTEATPPPPDLPVYAVGLVATVNGTPVSAAEFNDAMARVVKLNRGMSRDVVHIYQEQLMKRLIDELMVRQAVQPDTADVTDDDVEEAYQKFIDGIGSPQAVKQFFAQTGFEEATLKREMKTALAVKWLLRNHYDARVSEAEMRAYYDANLDVFRAEDGQPVPFEEVRAEIFEKLEAPKLRRGMRELMQELKGRASIQRFDDRNIIENPNFEFE